MENMDSAPNLNTLCNCSYKYRICRNKRPGRLIFRSKKKFPKPIGFVYSPLWKITHPNPSVLCTPPLWKITHPNPSVLCTPPFGKSSIQTHRFCVLPPLENHPSKAIGFVYSPLWKITVFGGRLFRSGRLFWQIRCSLITGFVQNCYMPQSAFRSGNSGAILRLLLWPGRTRHSCGWYWQVNEASVRQNLIFYPAQFGIAHWSERNFIIDLLYCFFPEKMILKKSQTMIFFIPRINDRFFFFLFFFCFFYFFFKNSIFFFQKKFFAFLIFFITKPFSLVHEKTEIFNFFSFFSSIFFQIRLIILQVLSSARQLLRNIRGTKGLPMVNIPAWNVFFQNQTINRKLFGFEMLMWFFILFEFLGSGPWYPPSTTSAATLTMWRTKSSVVSIHTKERTWVEMGAFPWRARGYK